MNNNQSLPHSYSYYCFKCKRKISADDVIRDIDTNRKENDQKSTKQGSNYSPPICPICKTRIKRNYKVWCSFCERIVKSSDLIRHRTLDGNEIRLCPHCGWDKTKIAEDIS